MPHDNHEGLEPTRFHQRSLIHDSNPSPLSWITRLRKRGSPYVYAHVSQRATSHRTGGTGLGCAEENLDTYCSRIVQVPTAMPSTDRGVIGRGMTSQVSACGNNHFIPKYRFFSTHPQTPLSNIAHGGEAEEKFWRGL